MPDNINWTKIKAEYLRGGTSYRKLAKKYGVSLSTLTQRAVRQKWADLEKQTRIKIDAELTDKAAEKEIERNRKFNTIADKLLEQIEEGIVTGNISINSRGFRGFKDLTGALRDLQELKGIRNELDIKEQLARIDKLRKEAERDSDNTDNKIVVEIQGEAESWSN